MPKKSKASADRRSLNRLGRRKWCRHIKWTTTTYGWKTYYFREGRNDDAWVDAESWVCCPLCQAKHPKLNAPTAPHKPQPPTKTVETP